MSDTAERHCTCGGSLKVTASTSDVAFLTDTFHRFHNGEGHAPATAAVAAQARRRADHEPKEPTPDPGDGRTWCPGCERWKFLVTHSCPGVPQGMSNLDFIRSIGDAATREEGQHAEGSE